MKKVALGIVCLLMLFSMMISCKEELTEPEIPDREYVESEVIGAAEELLLDSNKINSILWGVGLPTSQSEDAIKNGSYTQIDEEAANALLIFCVEDIRALCRSVYTKDICQMAERTVFSPVKDSENNIISLVRYYDYTPKDEQTQESVLMINNKSTVYFKRDVTYHTETIKVVDVEGEIIHLCVEVTVYNEEDQSQKRTLSFSLIEEEGLWRLASPTYMTYITNK